MIALCARCLILVAGPLLLGLGLGLGVLPAGPVLSSRNVSVMVSVPAPPADLLAVATERGDSGV
ncbi:MAG TPA: hypothetical protein VF136_20245 [Methylomirabilota bacterium]